MTLEDFNKAAEVRESISKAEKQLPLLDMKVNRFDDYINFMDGRVNPIKAHGKVYKKVEIKFNINERVTDYDVRDMFDIVEENKKEFIEFLKKCQNNYKKKIEEQKKLINSLNEEFSNIGNNTKEEAA